MIDQFLITAYCWYCEL